jgi:hypothetical protein
MMIEGDREPGHLPSEEFLAQMGKDNEELSKAGVLLDLAALHWSRGRSGQVLRRQARRDRRPLRRGYGDRRRLLDPPVQSMEEAIEWAKRLPFEAGGEPEAEGEIEIRQLFELASDPVGQPLMICLIVQTIRRVRCGVVWIESTPSPSASRRAAGQGAAPHRQQLDCGPHAGVLGPVEREELAGLCAAARSDLTTVSKAPRSG